MATTYYGDSADTDVSPMQFNEILQDYFMQEDEIPFIHNFYSPLKKIFILPSAFIPVALKRKILQYRAKY